ncbi:MAG: hypothetical protein Q9178_004624 [Gyalolechia marmorata]
MDAFAGEVTGMHPFFTYDSPAAAQDLTLADGKRTTKPGHAPNSSFRSSSQLSIIREDLIYTSADKAAVEDGENHVETTWHSLGTRSITLREGTSIVKHRLLDERD